MRVAIFLGLMYLGRCINPEHYIKTIFAAYLAIIAVVFFFMDILELVYKIRAREANNEPGT